MAAFESNRAAADATVQRLLESGALDEVEPSIVQAFLSLASAVDDPDAKADMWREYRAATAALKEAAAGGHDDDTAEFLISIQTPRNRAKVGDSKD